MNIEERLDFIEFRMDLLREDTELSKFLYDYNVTKNKRDQLYDVMDYFQEQIDAGKNVSSSDYENQVLQIMDDRRVDYHFCESFARILWEDGKYEKVFETLYKGFPKFEYLFNK
mgnify:CR=1 FL=1|nr:MAG TPA: Protein of unknown function (DUF1878) [Caudoviricetes sp.]